MLREALATPRDLRAGRFLAVPAGPKTRHATPAITTSRTVTEAAARVAAAHEAATPA